jgi:hypothetical protein
MYITKFTHLSILAKTFFNINKSNSEIKNKIICLNLNNLNSICSITYKKEEKDKFVSNTFIESYLELTYKSHLIKEKCIYYNLEYSDNLHIQYSLENYLKIPNYPYDILQIKLQNKLKLEFELFNNKEINYNFHNCLSKETQELLNEINFIIKRNKDKCIINE